MRKRRLIIILGQTNCLETPFASVNRLTYPIKHRITVGQIFNVLGNFQVNVIFAVTEGVKDHYDSLNQLLEDFTYVAKLESDSSNILKLVKMGYEDIVSVVDFHDDSNLGPVKIKYFTDCGVKGDPLKEQTRCTGVEFGMTLRYEAQVTLEACPEFIQVSLHISVKNISPLTLIFILF